MLTSYCEDRYLYFCIEHSSASCWPTQPNIYIHTYIHTCLLLIPMLWHRQAIFESKGDKLSSSAECRIRTQGLRHLFADKPTELSRIKLKTWTRQPVPMISKHSAHSTSLPVGFRTWLWRYTSLLLLISMLWHRQAIFEYIHTYIHTYMHACLLLLISMLWHRQAIFETKHYDVKSQSFNPGLQYPHLHGPVHTPDNNRWDTPPV